MLRTGTVRRRLMVSTIALVLASAGIPLVASSTLAAKTPLGVNLVLNPGAEAGAGTNGYSVVAIPNWETKGNFTVVRFGSPEFPTKAESNRVDGGRKFFSCGPDTEDSQAEQKIHIKGRSAAIDAGRIKVEVKVRMAGYLNGQDEGILYIGYFDADVVAIDDLDVSQSSGTNGVFRLKRSSEVLPAGTRLLWVGLYGFRANDGGSYCDAYFDRVSVRLERVD